MAKSFWSFAINTLTAFGREVVIVRLGVFSFDALPCTIHNHEFDEARGQEKERAEAGNRQNLTEIKPRSSVPLGMINAFAYVCIWAFQRTLVCRSIHTHIHMRELALPCCAKIVANKVD